MEQMTIQQVNYATRKSAPVITNGYRAIVSAFQDLGLKVIENRGDFVMRDDNPPNRTDDKPKGGSELPDWVTLTQAQIYKDEECISEIVACSNFALVVYDSCPADTLTDILDAKEVSKYLTRELTTPDGKGPIEIDFGFE